MLIFYIYHLICLCYEVYSLKVFPTSHSMNSSYDNDSDFYHFNDLNDSDGIDINLKIGEIFIAPQKIVHGGGTSDTNCISFDTGTKSLDLPYTHVSIHIDFCLVKTIDLATPVEDTTCYVTLNDNQD